MAEYIVDPVLKIVIDGLSRYVKDQVRWQTGMKEELKRLGDNYPKIQAVISYAKKAQTEDQALNKWISQLRDAIDEADDLLDDFEYHKHQNKGGVRRKLMKVGKRALKRDPELKRLPKVVKKLDRISAGFSTFLHLLKDSKEEQREQQVELHINREEGSLPKNVLIGRGTHKNFIIGWLRKPSYEETLLTTTTLYHNISVLSIVGDGGMGKTTLLQHVYQDGGIAEEFHNKMWVCVSDRFDVNKVIKDMLECLENVRPSLHSLNALQERLKSKVMSNKFLLVLDDIWDEEKEDALYDKLEKILAPLAYGGLGSKILITTRTDSVACMIENVIRKEKEVLKIDGMKEDECLQLLIIHAFPIGKNVDDHENLKSVAEKLVKKLYGSPLAAKVMGGVLKSNLDERHWKNVLNNSLGLNGIFPILKLSYIFLPEHLKSCFSFCSIFEQDHIFDKYDLIRMWIAAGFIQPSHDNRGETLTLEDIGERYFDALINKSFFDPDFDADGSTEGYKMHDSLHELAVYVSKQECFRFVGDEKLQCLEIPYTIRHLSFQSTNFELLKEMGRFKNLRTLLIAYYKIEGISDVLNEMFKVNRSIRLLQIPFFGWKAVSKKIENIKYLHHLRYLSLPFGNNNPLPRSLSSFYKLQFLINDRVGRKLNNPDDYFPKDMNNLSNLRNLENFGELNFPGIGKLKLLQEVKNFCIKNENGYRIEELDHMNELGTLEITNLKDVRDAQEACNARLCEKRKLTKLCLDWKMRRFDEKGCNSDSELNERVLDNLQPHKDLKTLKIHNYMGAKSAKWMNEAYTINNLEKIKLCNCSEWEILPPFGQLPFLKSLYLYDMPKVKRLQNKFHGNDDVCSIFPSLEKLYFVDMEAMVDWFDASVVDNALFPRLTTLKLYKCPNLQELPYLPPKLESLKIHNVGWKTLNCCNISKSIPLKYLKVYDCPNITSISLACENGKLESMAIRDCPNLILGVEQHQEVKSNENRQLIIDFLEIDDPSVLPMEPLRRSAFITKLRIEHNVELISFPLEAQNWFIHVSSSLRELNLIDLKSLKSLPSSIASISSLETLYVSHLPQLRELPDLPPSLKMILFNDLPSLESLPSSLLTNFSSLAILEVYGLPQLRELPDLPPSLIRMTFSNLPSVQSLPSSLTNISSLEILEVNRLPQLQKLPDLPPSLKQLIVYGCHSELMKRHQ